MKFSINLKLEILMRPVCLPVCLRFYNFSTLYTTKPHNLINDKLIDLIDRTSRENAWSCQSVCDVRLFDLEPSCIDKKLVFLCALIVLTWLIPLILKPHF